MKVIKSKEKVSFRLFPLNDIIKTNMIMVNRVKIGG